MVKNIKNIFDRSSKRLRSTREELQAIRDLEEKVKGWSDEEIKSRISKMKIEVQKLVDNIPADQKKSLTKVNRREKFPENEKLIQEKLWEFLPEVYAMLNESFRRTVGFAYHDVQLQAGILLGKGQLLVEQYTGEGKTMTFMLPLTLYSLAGRGAHLVTVNNYLTKVGGEYAGYMLSRLGISVGVISPEGSFKFASDDELKKYKNKDHIESPYERIAIDSMGGRNLIECTKRQAYYCDITYSTNNELGFDYLRDNMTRDIERLVQRELYYCIIDEADSILIDEARTPLIISATPGETDTEKYAKFAQAVQNLHEGEELDYIVDYKSRSVSLTEAGMSKVEDYLEVDNAWEDYSTAYHIENALKAKALFIKDDKYMVKNGEVYIVDEFTGRVLEGRRYSEGLHQAIEAKEGVEIKQESKTFATITFQNFFRIYKILSGGSGTIMTESEEFFKIYGLDSIVIPTNKPRIREDYPDRIYKTQEAKFKAVVNEIKEMNEIGRPVLVGTTSVEKSELISKMLDREGVSHEVLNAKFHEQESRIVAGTGKKGAVTVATNMAGRGTDIVIGGGARGDHDYKEVEKIGGLHVIGTERHDSRRIDNQLRGRTGRQGEPGSTRFYVSMDDQIMRVLGGEFLAKLLDMVRAPDNIPIELKMIVNQIETAQKRVEGVNFDHRKNTVEYDDVMNQHREIFYTRRSKVLFSTEQALGKFIEEDRVINLKLPENEDKKSNYLDHIERSKNEIEEIFKNLVLDTIQSIVYSTIPEGTKVNKELATKVIDRISKIIPPNILQNAFETNTSSLGEEYLKRIKNNEDPQEIILEASRKAFNQKSSELEDDYFNIIKIIYLESLDQAWVDHLEIMNDIRVSINISAGYAQRNPLVEYKNIAFQVFESFISKVSSDVASKFFSVTKVRTVQVPQNISTNDDQVSDILTGSREMLPVNSEDFISDSKNDLNKNLKTSSRENISKTITKSKKIGRNDRVTVEYTDGSTKRDIKYKKVQADVEAGDAKIIYE